MTLHDILTQLSSRHKAAVSIKRTSRLPNGRTNLVHHSTMLRVQTAALGAPILNDVFYPVSLPDKGDDFSSPRQLLARSIAIDDLLTGAPGFSAVRAS